jgi:hypothetical protein
MSTITLEKIRELKAICEEHAIKPLKDENGEAVYVFKGGRIIDAKAPYEAYDPIEQRLMILTEI